jgi:hypothetical protein
VKDKITNVKKKGKGIKKELAALKREYSETGRATEEYADRVAALIQWPNYHKWVAVFANDPTLNEAIATEVGGDDAKLKADAIPRIPKDHGELGCCVLGSHEHVLSAKDGHG